jgi:N-ethylmaleimide reductase
VPKHSWCFSQLQQLKFIFFSPPKTKTSEKQLLVQTINFMPSHLLSPLQLSSFSIPNRIVMSPLTRRRATDDHIPTEIMATYYSQRASAGLIISEATAISPQAIGYLNVPGIWNQKQVEAWKKITLSVHQAGGRIFMQLWHVGRVSHSLVQPGRNLPVSASALGIDDMINTPEGHKKMEVPHALETSEIAGVIKEYSDAALRALEAGFDGVEIHGANAYLIDQFLHSSSNIRTDQYGGTIENRARFLFEVVEAVVHVAGSSRVGIRMSPSNTRHGMDDPDPAGLFGYVINKLNDYKLAYLHLVEPMLPLDQYPHMIKEVTRFFRPMFKGPLITAGNYNFENGAKAIKEGIADMVAYGRLYIANPDLPERFAKQVPLNQPDVATFYSGGEKGYTDYPVLP